MDPRLLPPRLRAGGSGGSRWAIPAGRSSSADDSIFKKKKGLLGLGFGPDINLGVGTAASEFGQGLTAIPGLVGDLAPGGTPAGERWSQMGKGMVSGLAGSWIGTPLKPFFKVVEMLPGDVDLEQGFEEGVGKLLGDKEAYKAQDFMERVSDRGLLPAVIQAAGDVAIAGGAVTGSVRGASIAARLGGRAERAARWTAVHQNLIQNPLIHAAQHPYRTAGAAFQERFITPAARRVEAHAGMTRGAAPVEFLARELPDNNVDYDAIRVNTERHRQTAEAYKAAKVDDPKAHAAYRAFIDDVDEQYRHLTEDLGVEVQVVDHDPYRTPDEMVADLRDNKVLKINPTEEGAHPFLTPEQNNRFRAVHDAYGHAATGQRFGRHGEEAAFVAHSGMFSPEGQKALAMETRGQNSVLINDGDFPEQKAALLPDHLSDHTTAVKRFQKGDPTVPPGAVTKFLAKVDHRLRARSVARKYAHEARLALMEKKIAARSPAVNAAVRAARDHLMERTGVTRQEASRIVGDEMRSRMTGIKALEDEFLEKGLPEEAFIRAGVREHFVPLAARADEGFEAAMVKAVDAQLVESAKVREILGSSQRHGDKGLQADDTLAAAPTRKQQQMLTLARKRLEKAHSDVQQRKIDRARARVEGQITSARDKLGRIAHESDRLAREAADAVAEFDHSRTLTPKVWQAAGAMERSAQAIYDRTLAEVQKNGGAWGGATYDPHLDRFLEGGKDNGFSVGLVQDTAVKVPLAEFTPQHIEQVIRAYQDVYQHPNTTVGTWVDNGYVHIDPAQRVFSLEEGLILGAARHQESIFDFAGNKVVEGILRDRPDIANEFVGRHRSLSARFRELHSLVGKTQVTEVDTTMHLDMLMRRAAAAADNGLVKHPDEFFRKYVSKFQFAKKPSGSAEGLFQMSLDRSLATPEHRARVWKEVQTRLKDLRKVRAWYYESHALTEQLFRGKGEVTLLDGTKIDPADLMHQFVAITSFQAMPRDNWARAMSAFQRFDDLPRDDFKGLVAAMKKVTAGKATLEEAFGAGVGKGLRDEFKGFGLYPTPRQYLAEIISGNTMDKWTNEYLMEVAPAMGAKKVPQLDRARALAFIEAEYPDLVARIGEDNAVKEFYSRNHRAKILSFWENLKDPENSLSVTMDQQMERFFGEVMPLGNTLTGKPKDAWIRYSEQIRDMADELSAATGEKIMPHELQAVLWVFTKEELNRVAMGHFRAFAHDAADLVREGVPLADGADPISAWLDEATEPYLAEGPPVKSGKTKGQPTKPKKLSREHRVRDDDGTVSAETVGYLPDEGSTAKKLDLETGEVVMQRDEAGNLKLDKDGNPKPVNLSARDSKIQLFAQRRVKWLAAREQINADLAIGDIPAATKKLDDFVSHMTTQAPRSLGLLDDAPGASYFDIWLKSDFHSDGYLDAARAFDRLDVQPGELPTLMQRFKDTILGEYVPLDDGTRSVIRVFADGNLATLVHEDGHALRRMLNEGQMSAVERAYGIKDRTWSVKNEERFANDFVEYLRSGQAPEGMATTFARIKEVIAEVWDMVRGTFHQRNVHPDLADVFEQWLSPAERAMPDADTIVGLPDLTETGTMAQRAARPPKFPQPPAKSGDFYKSGRKGAQALARIDKLAARQRTLAATKAKVDKHLADLRKVLDEGTTGPEIERDQLVAGAQGLFDKVNEQMGTPSVKNAPARWQPLYLAAKQLGDEAADHPELASILEDLPQTLHEIQQLALSRGFDPAHVSEFSPTQVRRLVLGSMQLGRGGRDALHEAEAGARKKRTGTLARAGAVDRSVEAFLAATVDAIQEKRTNNFVSYIEDNIAQRIPVGAVIPEGYTAWDPHRTFLLTGEELSPDGLRALQTSATHMSVVPTAVVRQVDRLTKDFDHWAPRMIGKVTSPWRTLVLTLSPGWYVRNFVGNGIIATAEGVSLRDWRAAWRAYRKRDDIGHFADEPWVTSETLAQESGLMHDDSMIPRQGLGEAVREGGKVRGTAQYAARRMLRVNEVVDELARSAVYHNGLRKNMSKEAAWTRASEALVDYNNLSPFERKIVRSVVPFYAWQKGILKVTIGQVIDHPARVGLMMQMGQMQQEYLADRFGVDPEDLPPYAQHLLGDYNVRSFNPFADPSEVTTVEGITRSMNPFIELAIRKGMGAPEFYTDDKRLGFFGNAEPDVDVGTELGEIITRSPGGRILSEGPGQNLLGLSQIDEDALRSRLLRTRRILRGIPNPETQGDGGGANQFLPPRLRRAG